MDIGGQSKKFVEAVKEKVLDYIPKHGMSIQLVGYVAEKVLRDKLPKDSNVVRLTFVDSYQTLDEVTLKDVDSPVVTIKFYSYDLAYILWEQLVLTELSKADLKCAKLPMKREVKSLFD